MPGQRLVAWWVVLRLAVLLTAVSSLVVVAGGSALWFIERGLPDSTIRSWGDALWWSLTTLTTVGYGDHVPVTTAGRLIAAGVMVAGVAVIGAGAGNVQLVVGPRGAPRGGVGLGSAAGKNEPRPDAR